MIEARHSKWARFVYNIFETRLLKKNFSSFLAVNNFPEISDNKALIITPNHISWWDGFFINFTARRFISRKIHVMMLEDQLQRYKFFSRVGAFSIRQENPKSIIETFSYTKKILTDKNNFVVMYPQGEIEPFEKRPLNIRNGLSLFLKKYYADALVLPVAFKIQYYNKKYPSVIFKAGELLNSDTVADNFEQYKKKFVQNMDELNEAVFVDKFTHRLF